MPCHTGRQAKKGCHRSPARIRPSCENNCRERLFKRSYMADYNKFGFNAAIIKPYNIDIFGKTLRKALQ